MWHAPTEDPADLKFLWANRVEHKNAGEPLDPYYGKPLRELVGTYLTALPHIFPTMVRVAREGVSSGEDAGTTMDFGGVIYRVYFQALGASVVAVVLEDATDEHTAVQEFAAKELQARQELEQQAADLRRSNHDLEQFAYAASHDLQEPLRMVSSYCSLLQEEYGEVLVGDAQTYIGFAVDGAERMKLLIQGLLEFSRVGRNTTFTEVSLDDALDDAVAILNGSVAKRGGVIERERLPIVYGDRVMLSRLFLNLIGNALKFRRDEVAPRIRITCRDTSRGWEITVADNGTGFDPVYHDRIFQIFQRLGSVKNGTGIGLAICKKIVDRHLGDIWADSEPGAGSTFYFTLRKL